LQSRTTQPRSSSNKWYSERGLATIAEARLAVKNNTAATVEQQQMVLLMTEGGEKGLSIIADARLAVKNKTATEAQQRIVEGSENGLSKGRATMF
jgi:hypothetical protein